MSFSLNFRIFLAILHASPRAYHSCLPETNHQISKRTHCAREDWCAESHQAMDLCLPELSCEVLCFSRTARCELVPKHLCPSVKSSWISAALCLDILNPSVAYVAISVFREECEKCYAVPIPLLVEVLERSAPESQLLKWLRLLRPSTFVVNERFVRAKLSLPFKSRENHRFPRAELRPCFGLPFLVSA